MDMENNPNLTKVIDKLQKRYPGTRRQRSAHGASLQSVQFFKHGKLVADYDLLPCIHTEYGFAWMERK